MLEIAGGMLLAKFIPYIAIGDSSSNNSPNMRSNSWSSYMGVWALAQYKTLEELLEEWEDYKPKEPLIRHEGIRKTFRDWCVENGLDESEFRYYNNGTLRSTADDNYSIWFFATSFTRTIARGERLYLYRPLRRGGRMTRWELLKKAEAVLKGEYGNGDIRRIKLKEDYCPVQAVVNVILKNEDHKSKEIEKHKEAIRKLEEE